MERSSLARALRPLAAAAALGVALGGCGDVGPSRPYYGGGGYYGGPGYYGSPYYGGGYGRPYGGYYGGSRGYYGGGYNSRPTQRFEGPGTQERLRQHWIDQSRRPR